MMVCFVQTFGIHEFDDCLFTLFLRLLCFIWRGAEHNWRENLELSVKQRARIKESLLQRMVWI